MKRLCFVCCLLLCFTVSMLPKNGDAIVLPRLTPHNIEVKKEYYARKARISKRFRKTVYVLGAGVTVSLVGYFIFRLMRKGDSQDSPTHRRKKITRTNDFGSGGGLTYLDRLELSRVYRKERYSESIWDICAYNLKAGLTDWVYYTPLTLLGTAVFGVGSGLYYLLKDTCVQLWNGKDKEFFVSANKHLAFILTQFGLAFDMSNMFIDKEEIHSDFLVFLDLMESFVALVEEKIERDFEQGCLDENMYRACIVNKASLVCGFTQFVESLEHALNNCEEEYVEKEFVNAVFPSFEKLRNKIIRSLELYGSVFCAN